MPKLPASEAFAWPTYEIDLKKLLADFTAIVKGGSSYLLGGKYTSKVAPKDVNRIDCSGLVRYLLIRRGVDIVDGSQMQREWAIREGLKESDPKSAKAKDGVLRLAVLPTTSSRKVGHVVLILDGQTIESHGGVGPNRRPWTGNGWQGQCRVFVLTRPN